MSLTLDDLSSIRDQVNEFGAFRSSHHGQPAAASKCAEELSSEDPELPALSAAVRLAEIALEIAGDHLDGLTRCLEGGAEFAAFTCGRACLEQSSLATWLLDPSVDAPERTRRLMSLWQESHRQWKLFGEAAHANEHVASASAELDRLRALAVERGIEIPRAPKFTQITAAHSGQEAAYRLFSGMAHGWSWAMLGAGFEQLERTEEGRIPLSPGLSSQMAAALANECLDHFRKAAVVLMEYMGWESDDAR